MNVGAGIIDIVSLPHMVMNRDYLALLETDGLLDFDRIYHFQGGTVLKRIRDRSVLRMEIRDGDKHRIFYLKRHNPIRPGIKEMIGSLLAQGGSSPGMAEFMTICQFREHGIPTVVPVAAGEREFGGGRFESFLLTESFAPYISLEEIIRNQPESLKGAEGRIRKERLIKSIASLARTLHDQGFNHCDFNATHVLVSPEKDNGGFGLALFDLQRIDRKKWLRLKWFIKTMAQLGFTMPDPLFDHRDRLLLFHTYKGSSSMKLIDRFQLYWIRMKIQKISRHTEKINIRRKKNRGV
jgi:heptose I phosphotransferase